MKFCCYFFRYLLITGFVFSVSSAFASAGKGIEKTKRLDEENGDITQRSPSSNTPRAQPKVRKKRCHTVHPDMLESSLDFPISLHDITIALQQLKLMEEDLPTQEKVEFLDFSKPISSTELFFDFGELPRKLKKHTAKFAHLYDPEQRQIIGKFVEKVEYYAKENLLLRAENADLIDDLKELPKDYEMIALYDETEDFHKKNAYLENITYLHNHLSSGIAPRGSKFRNQWFAFEVMREEAADYIQKGYENFSRTEQLSSKVIRLTIDMVVPFYDFLKENRDLIEMLENEREAFYHLLHRYGGITKKTVQFEQAIDEFPSYIGCLREAVHEAEQREEAEAQQRAALLQLPQASPREVEKKQKSSPRRVNLSIDLTKTKTTPRKISAGQSSANHSKSGHPSPESFQKITLLVNDVPEVVERKRSNSLAGKSPRGSEGGSGDLSQTHSSDQDTTTTPQKTSIFQKLSFRRTDDK